MRYRVAVDAKNEIDPDFVIMAQCYARNAINGGMAETLKRLAFTRKRPSVDWVQFEAPHSVAEIKRARKVVKGPFSAMKGQLPRALTLEEHEALGLNAAWYTFLPDLVLKTSAWAFFQEFNKKICGLGMNLQRRTGHALYRRRKVALGRDRYERVEPVRSEICE